MSKIAYQSFCWVIGTTSFRTAKLNLKIEQQLILLDEFYQKVTKHGQWNWHNDLQCKYYDFVKAKGFLTGEAKRKDKDAREKTSGLVNLGLVSSDRVLTPSGKALLKIAQANDFATDNIFNISSDSFIYFKQLLKTSLQVNDKIVRPYIILAKCLTELKYLTYEEFTYFVPLIVDEDSTIAIIDNIKKYRQGLITVEEIIYTRLMAIPNYQLAKKILLSNSINEDLICNIGINRKSKLYDKVYYALYLGLKRIFLDKECDIVDLWTVAKQIKHKTGNLWRKLLFKQTTLTKIKNNGLSCLQADCPFWQCRNEEDLKELFFKYLHVFKAMATLSDYFDLNRRYLNISDTLIFADDKVELDVFPKYYFAQIMDNLTKEAFSPCKVLFNNVKLEEIADCFSINEDIIYQRISDELGVDISNSKQANAFIEDERYKRFNELIDKKFTDKILVELLDCFEQRNDKQIEALVTDEASIPTIFEYILGIIWYKISERKGNILDFMKLSLEANLLPKTHAAGGAADIVYEYEACKAYPKHSLLLEATLADKTNQRRMEMEPVSRHLGDYRIKFANPNDYSLFISTYLDQNVIADFRYRKVIPYTKNGKTIIGMKIISIDTKALKTIIKEQINYSQLYKIFDKYYQKPLEETDWQNNMIREITTRY